MCPGALDRYVLAVTAAQWLIPTNDAHVVCAPYLMITLLYCPGYWFRTSSPCLVLSLADVWILL